MVGLEIAFLIKKLQQEHDLRPEDVHIIGHSLGAHTAGYVGERVPGKETAQFHRIGNSFIRMKWYAINLGILFTRRSWTYHRP